MPIETRVWLYGREVGVLSNAGGTTTFTYDPDYEGVDLSASIPKDRPFRQGNVHTFLEGLLPDNDRVVERWARDFHISPNQRLELLRHVGLDLPGAIQISDTPPSTSGSIAYVSDRELGERLRILADDDAGWSVAYAQEGRFSLGGANRKTALYRDPDGTWAEPRGRFPSTHIVKPAMGFDANSDAVEFVTMKIANEAGLDVAHVDLEEYEGVRVVVVERYDRRSTPGGVQRIHQEDFCQALGVHPDKKYESRGGPTARQCLEHVSRLGQREVVKFVEGLSFNVSMWGSDAHAKNYAILYPEDSSPRLAPLYDMISAFPFHRRELFPDKHVRSALDMAAMSIGGERKFTAINEKNWARLARSSGVDPDLVVDTAQSVQSRLPDAIADVLRRFPLGPTVEKLGRIPFRHAGGTWVSAHMRGGKQVSGYWRHRRA